MAWQGRSMPQGWGDSQPCTDFARIDVSDAQVGTEKRALRSNQETDEGKLRRPGQLLDKKTPYKDLARRPFHLNNVELSAARLVNRMAGIVLC
jgi:hypothetical protein